MNKKSMLFFLAILFFGFLSFSQNNYERAYRIRKSQFPEKALSYISEKLVDTKRIRFYKETASSKTSFEAKFKKDRLWYGMAFDKEGVLEDIGVLIKPVDIPDESYSKIESYLEGQFSKYSVRRIQQHYPITDVSSAEKTMKNAFQNLMIPDMFYGLFVKGKKNETRTDYEISFDTEGNFIAIREALPANYDRVLY